MAKKLHGALLVPQKFLKNVRFLGGYSTLTVQPNFNGAITHKRCSYTVEFRTNATYLIGKKSVGKKFRRQKISSVINIRHLDKNSSLFTDEFFCRAI